MITTHCVFNFFQAEIKYLQYPAWGYVIYTLFVLIPVLCIIYPPIKDYVAQRRSESENSRDSLSTVCERCCYFGRSRSFDLEQSTSCVNGHVNQSVQADWSKQKNQEEALLGWKKLLLHNMANRVPRGKKRTAATVAHSSLTPPRPNVHLKFKRIWINCAALEQCKLHLPEGFPKRNYFWHLSRQAKNIIF